MKKLLLIITVILSRFSIHASEITPSALQVLYPRDSIGNFWNWFSKNQQRLRSFESNPDKYLTELLNEAKKIKHGLAIELEPEKNGVINMTISADGNIELFELVRQVVAKAPVIKGWNFLAFRQRMPAAVVKEMSMRVGNVILDPSKMKFLPVIDHGTLNIVIYVSGVNEENYQQVAYAGLLLLDNILGEYDCVTKVHSYDFHEFPEKSPDGPVPKPILELPAFVDEFHSKK
jgi:hypothetical protein